MSGLVVTGASAPTLFMANTSSPPVGTIRTITANALRATLERSKDSSPLLGRPVIRVFSNSMVGFLREPLCSYEKTCTST